jgi:hypothetical protein
MHLRRGVADKSPAGGALKLGRQLQQQPVVTLARLEMHPERQPDCCQASGNEIPGVPVKLASGV